MMQYNADNTKGKILIVDDEPYNLEIIEDYLDNTGYELRCVSDGAEAWELLLRECEDIDLVLLDRMLPSLNGMQILARMKEHSILQHTPVILQTAKVAKQDIVDGMQAGAFYYLAKPFSEEILRSVVKTALDEHVYYRSLQNTLEQQTRTLNLLRSGIFHFRSLNEAQDLALLISNACPSPGQVLTGLSELMINAIEHGNLGITYAEKTELVASGRWRDEVERRLAMPENAAKFATLEFANLGGEIMISLCDQGPGFDWKNYLEVAIDRIGDNHGRGIAMAKILSFDSLEFIGKGNKVVAKIVLQELDFQIDDAEDRTLATA